MRQGTVAFFLLLTCGLTLAGHTPAPPLPDRFTIGRDTFFDFGPPFHYVELLLVGPANEGTTIERVMLTPPGQACLVAAKVEVASATLKQSVASLFAGTNPCTIPGKDLNKELKRHKHHLVFSGATSRCRFNAVPKRASSAPIFSTGTCSIHVQKLRNAHPGLCGFFRSWIKRLARERWISRCLRCPMT
jgi:hypothetical protein